MYCRARYSRKRKGLFHSTTSENHILYYSFPLMFYCTNGIARRSVQYYHSLWESKWDRVRGREREIWCVQMLFLIPPLWFPFFLVCSYLFPGAEILMVVDAACIPVIICAATSMQRSVLSSLFLLTPPVIVWYLFLSLSLSVLLLSASIKWLSLQHLRMQLG